ncbi:MAG: DUF1588 domain-containing protein, partial [Myxococcota bacterium]
VGCLQSQLPHASNAGGDMLNDPRADVMIERFHKEWLHLKPAAELSKDPELYPEFDDETARDLEAEFNQFVQTMVRENRSVADLMSSSEGAVNQRLEPLLGVTPESNDNSDWRWRELGPSRAGVLGRPLFLASTAGDGDSLLIHRGVAVLEQILCVQLKPPDDVSTEVPEGVVLTSEVPKLRAMEARALNDGCSGCHNAIDPIGMAFERFDAIGAHREAYPGDISIDTTGVIPSGVEFVDSGDLMRQLATDVETQRCYASKWVEWSTGRAASRDGRCEAERIAGDSDRPIREVILDVVSAPYFFQRSEF